MALIIALIALTINIVVYVNYHRTPAPPKSNIASDEIKQKMKYHGTHILYEDWNGNHYFYRNGKKIRV